MKPSSTFINSDDPYKVLFEQSTDAYLVIEGNEFIDCNQATIDMLGYDKKEDIYKLHPSKLSPEYQPDGQLSKVKAEQMIRIAFENGNHRFEWDHMKKNGEVFPVEVLLIVIPFEGKKLLHVVWRDITERKDKEEQLRRSQKLEALGKLTGGIAHDYNNMLSIIRGYSELLVDSISENPSLYKYAQKVMSASERGMNLTRKLLAFTKQKTSEIKPLDLNFVLREQKLLLEKTLTPKITLHFDLEKKLWIVELDQGDFIDAIINLSINAAHAMEEGGQFSIRTTNERLEQQDAKTLGMVAGDYVMLSVADTGSGMDKATKERIFDPFFTTKGEKGTGLGLSQIHGFVESSGGKILVYSEPGYGTRFTIYFPRSKKKVALSLVSSQKHYIDLTGKETLLVVDDEPDLAELAKEILQAKGYTVYLAFNADEALSVLEAHQIDLMITDVVMPHVSGYQLSVVVQEKFPDVKIQIVSGFEDDHHKVMYDNTLRQNILYKPFTSHNLLARVRKLLDVASGSKDNTSKVVMVVDDEADVRELFALNLNRLGYQSILARNYDDAVSLYKQSMGAGECVDVVIVDLSLPGEISGNEIASNLRALDPNVKIIVSSGHSSAPEMLNYKVHGFDAALEKDFDREKMRQVIESVITEA